MTCFNQGDSEPPGHSGNEHPVAEDKPMDEQLDKNNTAEEHNAPTTLQILLLFSSWQHFSHLRIIMLQDAFKW